MTDEVSGNNDDEIIDAEPAPDMEKLKALTKAEKDAVAQGLPKDIEHAIAGKIDNLVRCLTRANDVVAECQRLFAQFEQAPLVTEDYREAYVRYLITTYKTQVSPLLNSIENNIISALFPPEPEPEGNDDDTLEGGNDDTVEGASAPDE